MSYILFSCFLLFWAFALGLNLRSNRQLSDRGRARLRERGWRLGPWFGTAEDFTPDGWRQRRLMMLCQALAAAALLAWGVAPSLD